MGRCRDTWCAAIPRELLESELFGHERGAFTGAHATKAGAFERADKGTLFFDEIGDMALEHQPKVLRALQEGEIQRVGGNGLRRVDVRVVAATHRDLRALVAEGKFREDLYYRLAGYELHLPPLRTRGRDILEIARAILERDCPDKLLSKDAERALMEYAWPGNIRQLVNVIRAAAVDAPDRRISDDMLRSHFQKPVNTPAGEPGVDLQQLLTREAGFTIADLRAALGVGKAAAHSLLADLRRQGDIAKLGDSRRTFYLAAQNGPDSDVLHPRLQLILRLVRERGHVTRRDYELAANVPTRTARRDLAAMVEKGLLCVAKKGKRTTYFAAEIMGS